MRQHDKYVQQITDAKVFWKKPLRLSHLWIEITERCNNDCLHCYINRPENDIQAKAKEMETSFIKSVLDQACDLGCLRVSFTGGEPLLRPDFKDIYLYAWHQGLRITLFSNGRLIDEKWIELFKNHPPGMPVELTTYGMTRETYDRVSQRAGAFGDFSRGLDLLKKNAIPFALRMAVLKTNRHEIRAYQEWCKTNNQSQHLFIYTLSLHSRRDNPMRNAMIRKQRIEPLLASQLLVGTANQSELVKFCGEQAGPIGSRLFNCGWGDEPAVDAYGFLQGCLMLRHPDFVFNLHTEPIKAALGDFFPKMKNRTTNNPEYLEKCGRCRFFGFCNQCPAISYMENGTLDTPVEYICQLTRAQVNMFNIKAIDDEYHHPLNIGYVIQ